MEYSIMQQVTTELSTFEHEDFGVLRIIEDTGEIWFIAMDVCRVLETRTDHVRSIVDPDEVTVMSNPHSMGVGESGGRKPLLISESGFYRLAMRSRKPVAKPFQDWVCKKVIPQIRKTGSYSPPAEESYEAVVSRALQMTQERIAVLETEVADARPKVEFYDQVTASESVCQLGVVCSVAGIPYGRNKLFAILRDDGVLISTGDRRNHPRQEYVDRGYFVVKEHSYTDAEGRTFVNFTPYATQKGVDWLMKRYGTLPAHN